MFDFIVSFIVNQIPEKPQGEEIDHLHEAQHTAAEEQSRHASNWNYNQKIFSIICSILVLQYFFPFNQFWPPKEAAQF